MASYVRVGSDDCDHGDHLDHIDTAVATPGSGDSSNSVGPFSSNAAGTAGTSPAALLSASSPAASSSSAGYSVKYSLRPEFSLNTEQPLPKFGDISSGHEYGHRGGEGRSNSLEGGGVPALGHMGHLAPLSRAPSQWRDFVFLLAFGLHFFLMSIFDLIPDAKVGDTVIPREYGGLWVSIRYVFSSLRLK
jgi:hypothetical protein